MGAVRGWHERGVVVEGRGVLAKGLSVGGGGLFGVEVLLEVLFLQRALQRQSAMAGETLGQETLTVGGAFLPSLTEDVSKPRARWGKKRGVSYLGGT